MVLNTYEQIKNAIDGKKHILIIFPKDSGGDGLSSSIALLLFLNKMNLRTDIVSPDFVHNKNYNFLKKTDQIKSELGYLQKFIITVDIEKQGLQEVSYDIKNEHNLRLFLTPKRGFFEKQNVRVSQTNFKYDLIFAIDSPDLESFGKIYEAYTDFFNQTPIINIDHKNTNELFGHINYVQITSTTTAEILFELFKNIHPEFIDPEIATALLTGIISDTKNFTEGHVKPHTLSIAGELMKLGADRHLIVKNLQQNKTISTFRLWGQVLSHLEHDEENSIIWTTITRDDFKRTNSKPEDLTGVIEEIISHSPEAKIIVVIYEDEIENNKIHCIVKISLNIHATELMKPFSPTGDQDITRFTLQNTLLFDATQKIIGHIRKDIKNF